MNVFRSSHKQEKKKWATLTCEVTRHSDGGWVQSALSIDNTLQWIIGLTLLYKYAILLDVITKGVDQNTESHSQFLDKSIDTSLRDWREKTAIIEKSWTSVLRINVRKAYNSYIDTT